MTRSQFALALNADEKWVENATRLLGLSLSYTPIETLWIGLLRIFNHNVGLSLSRSAELATETLRHAPSTREVKLGESTHKAMSAVSVVLDVARYHSQHNAALSSALVLGGARRRGRPLKGERRDALERAIEYGVDVGALREGLRESPATRLKRLEQNATFVAAMRTSAAGRPVSGAASA